MSLRARVLLAGLALLLALPAWGQARRDPLTYAEADQIRELAQDPVKRLRLMLQFTQARITSIDQLRAEAGAARGRGEKVRLLLEDFGHLVDELDANLEMFATRDVDLRKVLGEVLAAANTWSARLAELKEGGGEGDNDGSEHADYEFTLENVVESVEGLAETGREVLQQQEEERAKKKRRK